ncbi:MAG: outer membrane lipoprotein carrier protein LolA [Maribacter sp.]|nr:outer membrane lipoprotein carrier protein LolA [Maribacter sp.]
MKRSFLIIMAIICVNLATAQSSDKAKALLDDVYNKVKSYENIYVDFKYALTNLDAGTNDETRGHVTMQGDKYLANFFGAQQLFDGDKVYTIVPENEEVTIEDKSEDENTITPSKMLTFYRQGHTYAWDILQNIQGRKIQFIKLIPMDSNTEIKSILLGIDAQTKHIYKVIQIGENGTMTTITVNSFKTNQPLSKTLFTFDENKYKDDGYYIIRN